MSRLPVCGGLCRLWASVADVTSVGGVLVADVNNHVMMFWCNIYTTAIIENNYVSATLLVVMVCDADSARR